MSIQKQQQQQRILIWLFPTLLLAFIEHLALRLIFTIFLLLEIN